MNRGQAKKRLKVLLCIPSLALGGAEKFVVDLAKRIDQTDFDLTVGITRNNSIDFFKKELDDANVSIVDLSGRSYLEMCIKQFEYFKEHTPDVIHANVGSVLHLLLCSILFPNIKRIYTIHNEPQLLYHNNSARKAVYRFAFTIGRFIPVGISKTIQEEVVQDFRLNIDDTRVVNNGVDTELFSYNPEKRATGVIKIISTGRLHKVKNQKLIIKVFGRLLKLYPNISLTILGEGEMRKELEELIKELNLQEYVNLPGSKTNVASYLQKADIYVSCSLTEGLPLSILEAMSCGLPVVATNVGGTKDVVNNGINGFLVEKNDEEGIFKSLLQLVSSEELRNSFGKCANQTAQKWSLAQCAHGYEQLYEEISSDDRF